MIPVNQEFIHDPANGVQGDCLRAVIASILEVPIADVPHFAQETSLAARFWELVYEYVKASGHDYVPSSEPPSGALPFHVLSGPSPRGNGTHHAVVGRAGAIIHDPHPSRAGLAGEPSEWRNGYLVPRIAA